MLILSPSRKADKNLYNSSSEDFIPIACHYDESTLITKNGELIQIIQINGINSENISDQLFNLREVVRTAIRYHIESDEFAFWIHTVRCKTNLDDLTPYNKVFPANVHDIWRFKNYWNDKFVNTLYISIVFDSASIKTNSLSSFINSLFYNSVLDFHNKYITEAHKKLNNLVNVVLSSLEEYGAVKLGIKFEGQEAFSYPLSLYYKIIHLKDNKCRVPLEDLSNYLASQQYAVGGDIIEVIDDQGKKFVGMLSIKEYQEVSSEALDNFLQVPVELIATEIFYFVDKKNVASVFDEQDYILKVSGDNSLREVKGITRINSSDPLIRFCRQQISISIISDNLERLNRDIETTSKELAKIGIIHVREDTNLEQTFWAQLPGNFNFLKRLAATILRDTSALASLHNSPTGNQSGLWGKAITLLRTEKGTPYFMNFHDKENKGVNCIFGTNRTGKTVLMNFLISESTKYNPTILYFSTNNDSKIFIEALEGTWSTPETNIINPLLCEDNPSSRKFVTEFLTIICNHYVIPLTDEELKCLEDLTNEIFAIDYANRNLSNILKTLDFSNFGGDLIRSRLSVFDEGALYHGLFDNESKLEFSEAEVLGFNLYNFSDKYFSDRFFPEDKKLVEKFTNDLNVCNSIRFGIIYSLTYQLSILGNKPKILALDNFSYLINQTYFYDLEKQIFDDLVKNNGVVVSNFDTKLLHSIGIEIRDNFLKLIDTKIILPSDIKIDNLDKILDLNKLELNKLLALAVSSRMFLIKRSNESIITELSIGGLIGITRMLSGSSDELNIYEEIRAKYIGGTEIWVPHLYKALGEIE